MRIPAVGVIAHESRNPIMSRVLSGAQVYDGRGEVITLPVDRNTVRRSEYGEHDFPATEVNGDGVFHNTIRGLSISGKLDVNMLRGAV